MSVPTLAITMTALTVSLSGIWIYAGKVSEPSATGLAVTHSQAPDAVQIVLQAGKPTIIEFGANNCVSCREMKPILHALAQDPRIAVADIDILTCMNPERRPG